MEIKGTMTWDQFRNFQRAVNRPKKVDLEIGYGDVVFRETLRGRPLVVCPSMHMWRRLVGEEMSSGDAEGIRYHIVCAHIGIHRLLYQSRSGKSDLVFTLDVSGSLEPDIVGVRFWGEASSNLGRILCLLDVEFDVIEDSSNDFKFASNPTHRGNVEAYLGFDPEEISCTSPTSG